MHRHLGDDAAAHEGEPDLRRLGQEADVAVHGEADAGADGVTVERGDHGLQYLRREHRRVRWLGVLRSGTSDRAGPQIGAHREDRAGARDDDDAHVVVPVRIGQDLDQLDGHAHRPRVALLGAVEGDQPDASLHLVADEVHRRTSYER